MLLSCKPCPVSRVSMDFGNELETQYKPCLLGIVLWDVGVCAGLCVKSAVIVGGKSSQSSCGSTMPVPVCWPTYLGLRGNKVWVCSSGVVCWVAGWRAGVMFM